MTTYRVKGPWSDVGILLGKICEELHKIKAPEFSFSETGHVISQLTKWMDNIAFRHQGTDQQTLTDLLKWLKEEPWIRKEDDS